MSEYTNATKPLTTLIGEWQSETATNKLKEMFGGEKLFDFPKPVDLIKFLIEQASRKNSTILDFFAGSGTTGQAVLELNREDGGTRQFILATNNEGGIAENVTLPRLRTVITGQRADGTKYSDGIPANLRYFRTDFVEKEKSLDATRAKLVSRCADMIRIRENCFEEVADTEEYRFYGSAEAFTAIVFNPFKLREIWAEIEKADADKLPVKLYVFSYTTDTFDDEIPETELIWESCPIPESVLKVYRKLQKEAKR